MEKYSQVHSRDTSRITFYKTFFPYAASPHVLLSPRRQPRGLGDEPRSQLPHAHASTEDGERKGEKGQTQEEGAEKVRPKNDSFFKNLSDFSNFRKSVKSLSLKWVRR